jgi:hypothetical protein
MKITDGHHINHTAIAQITDRKQLTGKLAQLYRMLTLTLQVPASRSRRGEQSDNQGG